MLDGPIGRKDDPERIAERVAAKARAVARTEAPAWIERSQKHYWVVADQQPVDVLIDNASGSIRDDGFRREVRRMNAAIKHPKVYCEQRGRAHEAYWVGGPANPAFRTGFDSSYFDHLDATKDETGWNYRTFLFRGKHRVNFGNMNYYFTGMGYKAVVAITSTLLLATYAIVLGLTAPKEQADAA